MMRSSVLVFCLVLYLVVGLLLFILGVFIVGGKEGYRMRLESQGKAVKNWDVVFIVCMLAFMFTWPYFLCSSINNSRRGRR